MINLALLQNNSAATNSPLTTFSSPIKMATPQLSHSSSQPGSLLSLNPFCLNNSILPQQVNQFALKNATQQAPIDQDILLQHINHLLIQKEKQEQQQMQQKLLIDALLTQIQAQQSQQQIQQQQRQLLLQQINMPTINCLKNANEESSYPNSISSSMTNINVQPQIYNMEHKLSVSSFPSCDNIKREEEQLQQQQQPIFFPQQQQPTNFFFPQQSLVQQQIQQQQLFQQQLLNAQNLLTLNPLTSELNIKRKFEELDSSSQSESTSIHKKKLIINGEEERCVDIKSSMRNTTSSTLPNTPTLPSSMTKSKSEIKKEDLKDPRSRSRFHNLTKLFLNSLLSIFTRENMSKINIEPLYQEEIIKCIARVKQSGRKTQGKVCKTDLFNHSHYNVLFLKLTHESIQEIANKPKDANIHKACFDIDVTLPIPQFQLDHINKIKKYIFEITQSVLGNPVESDSVRDEYWLRAMVGIKQLSEGKLIYRFQSISSAQATAAALNNNKSSSEDEEQESN
ncbi:hypothetical protein ABPG74_011276 [Tetrahymena malaccensis]